MKKIKMLRNHRELVVRHEYSVPDEINEFRAGELVSHGFAEEIEMAVIESTERAVAPRQRKKNARRKRSADE